MNVILIYPEFPDTFWSFKHALKFIQKGVPNGHYFRHLRLPFPQDLRTACPKNIVDFHTIVIPASIQNCCLEQKMEDHR
jgi:hypothetical protein